MRPKSKKEEKVFYYIHGFFLVGVFQFFLFFFSFLFF